MTRLFIQPISRLEGSVHVPGDKSISHRALLLGGLADGDSTIEGLLKGSDCMATFGCLRAMGIAVEEENQRVIVHGRGVHGLQESSHPLDCVRSGTTMRLLAGLLAGQKFNSKLNGDEQLLRRPMRRVADPLNQMGADVRTKNGFAPIEIHGKALNGIQYKMPVSSAQVKSAIVLAGLYAKGETVVHQPGPTRDHTERMLAFMGARIEEDGLTVRVTETEKLLPLSRTNKPVFFIPGDISSAAFIMAAGCLVADAQVCVQRVGVNPTRTGLLDVLAEMGAQVRVDLQGIVHDKGEPVADVTVESSRLKAVSIGGEVVVRMIDEFPMLAVIASQAQGKTIVRNAEELRVKETDRIATVVEELRKLGAKIDATDDGFIVEGSTPLHGGLVNSHGDHRLAMALAIAGLIAKETVVVERAECIGDSFTGFIPLMQSLGAVMHEE